MENRKQIFVEGEHCYSLAQQENMTMLYYADSEVWNSTCRGQFVLGLECTGNDFKIVGGLIDTLPHLKDSGIPDTRLS